MSYEKVNRILTHEKFADVDGILITKSQNVLYILGFGVESDVTIFIPNEEIKNHDSQLLVFLNALEYDQAKKNIENDDYLSKNVEIKLIPKDQPNFISDTINDLNIETIGFEDDYISTKTYKDWQQKFKKIAFVEMTDVIRDARKIKTYEEILRMEKAAEIGEIGFKTIYEIIKEGTTERELAAEAEYSMRKAGSDGTSFNTIVASGENSAYPHAKTSDKKIKNGDLVIVDIGAKYNGYCSDMTRTFVFGKVDQIKKDLVNLVNESEQYALEHAKAGVNCKSLDKLIRNFFKEKNKSWASRFIHSLGHGVGIDIHENPYLSPISEETLESDMVVTIEPGLYIPGIGGCRTEDQIIIKKDKFVSLTHTEKFNY